MIRLLSSSRFVAWSAVGLWTAMIFISVPLVRGIREPVAERIGASTFGWITLCGLLVATAAAGYFALQRARRLPLRNLFALLAVCAIAVGVTLRLWQRPEEAVHLLEYGVLGLLLANALKQHTDDASAFLVAVLIGGMIGIVDEVLQYVTPDRYFDYRDIWINTGAVALAQLAIWLGIPRESPRPRPSIRSLRSLCRFGAAFVVLIGLCLAATPHRLEALTSHWQGLRTLLDPKDAIAEYGFRHVFPDQGEFKSRFTLTELRQLDEQQGPFAGLTVERYRYRYLEFLRIYTPAREPFTHEVQVHLQSRGVNIALAKQEQVGSRKQKKLATRAFRENQILETFFPVTLKHAEAWLSPKQSNTLRSGFLPDYRFVSLAGIRIITFASEKQLRVFLIICLIALIAAERWLARRG